MAEENSWRIVGQRGLTARIRGEILRVMTERRLKPGDRLPAERELAALLGVSRPSVREAIRLLQAEGRLDVRHGAGVFVTEPETQQRLRRQLHPATDLDLLYDMREVLEVPAARWAAQRQRPELAAVRQAFDALDAYTHSDFIDFDELQRLDITFHTRIVQASGNNLLEQTQSVIYDLILEGMRSTLMVPGRLAASRVEHAAILTALEAGDPDAAAAASYAHIQAARAAATENPEQLTRRPTG
ncbi:FadR/GntR family transcriptional regulator [Enemella evansiae]|uniref:FadR/GntR family transcriptional regulator n=1 Tax=Enemella evansiae TaxID=2016499 RepID=UPI000B9791CB|nr:FCD domain-containing protein [Enemella evansiae]OYO00351.1 GntR family transcriptional regulator [Enemella evansiae]OYO03659.1 GntR family transcriptional regulator [Enemella evansiae]PFG68406.1 GntR family transcriptional regulator [Propionibacteriaceae bacterium ES.041]